jgi:mannose-6-phosphate isomerase-like protein (cupin superfamily)
VRQLAGCVLALVCFVAGPLARAQATNVPAAEKPLLESKTVTEAELDLSNQPFVFDGVPRGLMARYFNGRTAGTRSFVVGQFRLDPGSEPHPVHAHADDELLIVTAGEGEVDCAGRTTRVAAGSVMYSAPNVPHGIRNTGQTPLTFYFVKWIETATEAAPNTLTPAEVQAGWRLLWDGHTAEGWVGAKGGDFPADVWRMEQGTLAVEPTAPGAPWRGADIVPRERFGDFEFTADFRVPPGANSGIKYFVAAEPGQGSASSLGLEYQLIDDDRHPDAKQGRDGNRRLASAYDLFPAATAGVIRPAGEWNTARIVARGSRVEHWLNGVKVLEYDRSGASFRGELVRSKYREIAGFGQARDGHILLQDHGDRVQFRNLKIRPAPVAGTVAGGR